MKLVTLIFIAIALSSCSTLHTATVPSRSDVSSVKKKEAQLKNHNSQTSASEKEIGVYKSNELRKKYSEKLNVEAASLENIKLFAFIDDWYGTPYKYAGNDKRGIDCSGFACALYQVVYERKLEGSSASLYQQCERVKRNDLQEGDLVFFKINRKHISHVGIFIANDYFVHASTKVGVVLSSLNEDYYRKYYVNAGRLNEK